MPNLMVKMPGRRSVWTRMKVTWKSTLISFGARLKQSTKSATRLLLAISRTNLSLQGTTSRIPERKSGFVFSPPNFGDYASYLGFVRPAPASSPTGRVYAGRVVRNCPEIFEIQYFCCRFDTPFGLLFPCISNFLYARGEKQCHRDG
jgi:hypothetical protein